MSEITNKRYIFTKRPVGDKIKECFTVDSETINLDSIPNDKIVVKTIYLSLDPAMRIWMNETSYNPVPLNSVFMAFGVGEVIKGGQNIKKGDFVSAPLGWQQYAVLEEAKAFKVDTPSTMYLNELGHIGQTAYWGLMDRAKLKEGERVYVSTAAGAVGSIVCQIAKLKGCKVVGSAGSAEKVEWLKNELGIEAFNYKDVPKGKFSAELKKRFPEGIDVYFDNVGGEQLEAVLSNIRFEGRIALCGAISQYNSTEPPTGPRNYTNLLFKQATMSGFIVSNYASRFPEAIKEMLPWIQQGKIKARTHIEKGFENLASSLELLYQGKNKGKLIAQVSEPPK